MSGEHRITDHRWEGFTDESLADVIDALNSGAGPAAIAGPVEALQTIAESLYEIDTTLHDKLGKLGVEWQAPQSARLARSAVAASQRYAGRSGDAVTLTMEALARQADAYARARDGVPPSSALRGAAGGASLSALVEAGAGALTAHGTRDIVAAQQRQREARARAVDALRGYNHHANDTLVEQQPLPGSQPATVDRAPVASETAVAPATPPSPDETVAPAFGAPQVTEVTPSGAAPPVATGGEPGGPLAGAPYPAVSHASGVAQPGGGSGWSPAAGYQGGQYRYGVLAGGQQVPGGAAQGGGTLRGGSTSGPKPVSAAPYGGSSGDAAGAGRVPEGGSRGAAGEPGPGGKPPLAEGGRTGVGPDVPSLPAGGTAYAARGYRGVPPVTAGGVAMGSAVAAGTAGAGMAGSAAEPDRLARGRGAPSGAGPSLHEEVEPDQGSAIAEEGPGAAGPSPEEVPLTERATGGTGADADRVRRFGTESDELFAGPVVGKPVIGELAPDGDAD